MKRYQKANEGVHAPEESKERAARPAGRPSRARWLGAVAAVLAVVILGGVALWPGRTYDPSPMSLEGPSGPPGRSLDPILTPPPATVPTPFSTGRAAALATAVYPETAPYPKEEDYISPLTGNFDYDKYSKDYDAWQESLLALASGTDYAGMMDGFLSASTAQFLAGAGAENRIYSPLNVYMALSMLAETAGGNSRQQLLDLLDVDSVETLRRRASALWRDNYRDDGAVTSLLANSMWLRDGTTYSQEVLDTLARDYYASSFSGEMGSEEYNLALRSWLNEQTKGLLAQQADGVSMDADTVLALASTVYFKAAWSGEFDKYRTEPDIFHASTGDVETDFMRRSMEGIYYWGERFAAVELSFKQGGSMWLILPDEGTDPDGLLTTGEAMEFLLTDKYSYAGSKFLTIHLSMPKFDVSSELDLIGGLEALGVTDVFDCRVSDFDPLGASTDYPLYVSQARHAARVKVDEEGCEAAAFTLIGIGEATAMPPADEVNFILDRPFLFAVTGESGLPLFVGVVNQPNE